MYTSTLSQYMHMHVHACCVVTHWVLTASVHGGPEISHRLFSLSPHIQQQQQRISMQCHHFTSHTHARTTHLYSAPHPFTKLMRIVHMRVNWYTASNPRFTVCARSDANSWLLNIFRLHPTMAYKANHTNSHYENATSPPPHWLLTFFGFTMYFHIRFSAYV